MGNVRVEYTITVKGANGEQLSFNKERILTEQDETNPKHIEHVLEKDFRATEQTSFLAGLQTQLGEEITSTTFKITKMTELHSAGDDDQM